MYPGTDIYAIGTDETVSFFALQSQKEDEEEPSPKVWGDVRDGLGCEYVVDMCWIGERACVAAGKHRYVFFAPFFSIPFPMSKLKRVETNRLKAKAKPF